MAWGEWIARRVEIKKSLKSTQVAKQLNRLSDLGEAGAVNQSTRVSIQASTADSFTPPENRGSPTDALPDLGGFSQGGLIILVLPRGAISDPHLWASRNNSR